MHPARILRQAVEQHRTPLIKFLGKRGSPSMFRPAFSAHVYHHHHLSALPSSTPLRLTHQSTQNNPQTQPPQSIPLLQPRLSPTPSFNTDPKPKTTDPSVIAPLNPVPPPRRHPRHDRSRSQLRTPSSAPSVRIRVGRWVALIRLLDNTLIGVNCRQGLRGWCGRRPRLRLWRVEGRPWWDRWIGRGIEG